MSVTNSGHRGLLLCLVLGVYLAAISSCHYSAHAWTPSLLSRRISNRAVAGKVRATDLDAQSVLTNSNNKDRRRWWRFGRNNKQSPIIPSRPSLVRSSNIRIPKDQPGQSQWDAMKRAVYGTADAVAGLPSRLRGFRAKRQQQRVLSEGYEALEAKVLRASATTASSRDTPAQRLMQEYETRALSTISSPTKTELTTGEVFDRIKESLYKAASTVTARTAGSSTPSSERTQTISQDFKPVTKPTVSTSKEVISALPGLTSSNPLAKWSSQRRIKAWEVEQQKRQGRASLDGLKSVKDSVYQVTDAAQAFTTAVLTFPVKVVEAAEATRDAAIATIEWFTALPAMVEGLSKVITDKFMSLQMSVEDTIETTQSFVDDVQAIPEKVQSSIEGTQQWVDDAVYNVRVLTGQEELKPHPPETPPPPPSTVEEIAWEVTGAVAKETAKVAWWAGTGVAKLSWEGAKVAFATAKTKAKERLQEGKLDVPKDEIVATGTKWSGIMPEVAAPKKSSWTPLDSLAAVNGDANAKATVQAKATLVNTGQEDLDREVSDALLLAQKAIDMADDVRLGKDGKTELDKALERAKEAAVVATREAVEIEKTLERMS